MSRPKTPRRRAKRKSAVVSSEIVLPLLDLGDMMSNLCFNLKQDNTQRPDVRRSMSECQTKWDAARRTFHEELKRQNDQAQRPGSPDAEQT